MGAASLALKCHKHHDVTVGGVQHATSFTSQGLAVMQPPGKRHASYRMPGTHARGTLLIRCSTKERCC